MIEYEKKILKDVEKGSIPERVFLQLHHCFQAIESIGDMSLFDIKQIKGESQSNYYRLRKGQYRAIFTYEQGHIRVIALEHRSEVYKKWRS